MIYFSSKLLKIFPELAQKCVETLCKSGDEVGFLYTKENIWIRDFMPIKTSNFFTSFGYETLGYKDFTQLQIDNLEFLKFADIISPLILDGGNITQNDDYVLITDKVFKWNKNFTRKEIERMLGNTFFKKKIIYLPSEPYDDLGHSDGIVHFVNNTNKLFVNDYSRMKTKYYDNYYNKLLNVLRKANLELIPFPFAYYNCPIITKKKFAKEFPHGDFCHPAIGYYINMLSTNNCVLVPTFGFEEDFETLELVKKEFPNHIVEGINCSKLAMLGGLLNCISWQTE